MSDTPTADLPARLLDSALAIADEHGVSGLTVRAVAKAAGCSTMGVYTHYNGKSGLLDAIVEWGFDSLDEALERAFCEAGGGRDGLIATARAFRAWAIAHATPFHAMFVPTVPGYEPSIQTRERSWDTFYAHRSRVAAAFDSADADPVPWHSAAANLWACLHGHVSIELLRRAYLEAPEPLADFDAAVEQIVSALELSAGKTA